MWMVILERGRKSTLGTIKLSMEFAQRQSKKYCNFSKVVIRFGQGIEEKTLYSFWSQCPKCPSSWTVINFVTKSSVKDFRICSSVGEPGFPTFLLILYQGYEFSLISEWTI